VFHILLVTPEPPSDFPGERDQHGDASCNPLILRSLQYRFQVEEA
jgi:hypothetical protein